MPPQRRTQPAADERRPVLHIDTHRALVAKRRQIIDALERRPELLRFLALNPVQAFHDAGVTLSPELADHVMDTMRFPPALRAERDQLTAQLTDALGEEPKLTSEAWIARTLFGKLAVAPLDLTGQQPVYLPATDEQATERLLRLLGPRRRRPPDAPPPHAGLTIGLNRQSDRLLDLDAPVPDRPPARHAPQRLSLAQLWFYRDRHELVPPLLRLGVVLRSGVMMVGPSAYKRIVTGGRPNQLSTWIDGVRFPPRGAK